MVAVAGADIRIPGQARGRAVRQLVAVATSPRELRPGSDLVARFAGIGRIDLLLLTDGDPPAADPYDDPDDTVPDPGVRFRALAANLGLPRLDVHRLALPGPPRVEDVDDIVAAVSELVGFDPEPGVGCLVPVGAAPARTPQVRTPSARTPPARTPPTGARPEDPADLAVARAIARIAAVYRLPIRTYAPSAG